MRRDLFDYPEELPDNVQALLDEFSQREDDPYQACGELVEQLEKVGYTCNYDLSGTPFDLQILLPVHGE